MHCATKELVCRRVFCPAVTGEAAGTECLAVEPPQVLASLDFIFMCMNILSVHNVYTCCQWKPVVGIKIPWDWNYRLL